MKRFAFVLMAVLAAATAFAAEMVDNPAYGVWSKFKVGAELKYKQASEVSNMKTESEITYKLLEVTPEKVVVEMGGATVVAGNKMEMPATKMDYPAKIENTQVDPKLAEMVKADSKTTEEQVTVPAGSFKCKVVESTMNQQGAEVSSKIWASDEVPGSLVKMVTTMTAPMKSVTTMELVEKKLP
ncbi:MAG: hypothetical protein BWY66_00907 [bacterium ADurb.Bin374]|nr:MAG: hypothetical protein BWY66_00907 [bacterium ADurb.Bin374]